jgi:hypothetical protein
VKKAATSDAPAAAATTEVVSPPGQGSGNDTGAGYANANGALNGNAGSNGQPSGLATATGQATPNPNAHGANAGGKS